MADVNYVGDDNEAWKKGPYLSAPANGRQIDRGQAYCFRSSDEFSIVGGIVLGPNPKKSKNGGVQIPLPPRNENHSRVEPVIAKLAIIEQFELFKDFLITFDGPFNKKQRKKWECKISSEMLDLITSLTNRRNELTHDTEYSLPSIRESVEYFYQLREVSKELYSVSKQASS